MALTAGEYLAPVPPAVPRDEIALLINFNIGGLGAYAVVIDFEGSTFGAILGHHVALGVNAAHVVASSGFVSCFGSDSQQVAYAVHATDRDGIGLGVDLAQGAPLRLDQGIGTVRAQQLVPDSR